MSSPDDNFFSEQQFRVERQQALGYEERKVKHTIPIVVATVVGSILYLTSACGSSALAGGQQSKLAKLAARMKPGEWAELKTIGFEKLPTVKNGCLFFYSDEAMWDSVTKRLFFMGAAHGGKAENAKFIRYDDATNSWEKLPLPDLSRHPVTHAYDMQAFDSKTGTYFYRRFNRPFISAFTTRKKGLWKRIYDKDSQSKMYGRSGTNGLAFIPEIDCLALFSSNLQTVYALHVDSQKVTLLGTHKDIKPTYHEILRYNPVHKLAVFGGGNDSRQLFKLDAQGNITALKEAPFVTGITHTVFTLDPLSGKHLVFSRSGDFYEFDLATDTWSKQDASRVPFLTKHRFTRTLAAPITNYGVVMFLVDGEKTAHVYLYKHKTAEK